jgi:V8-like Glu-specific endopeptidase
MRTASRSRFKTPLSIARVLLCVGCFVGIFAASVNADEGLNDSVLKAVKRATVHLRVKLANERFAEGSGWFAVEKGLIITNAHVLGMIDADSRRPLQIEATIHSGEENSQSIKVKLLGVGRFSDLAVLRAEGEDLPEPLALGNTADLNETQTVYIFGFPFGKQLGKNITVSKSSVSSLRKENGELKQVQVNGGIHSGNSGGPVVDSKGQVIGVAVSAIPGTLINFAIPSGEVADFLAGRIYSLSIELAFLEGSRTKVPVRMLLVDPLSRVKEISVEHWVAPKAKSKLRPATKQAPEPLPEDSALKSIPVEYDGDGNAYVEVEVDPLSDAKLSHWFRPNYTDGAGEKVWYRALGNLRPNPVERVAANLKFAPPTGKGTPFELTDNSTFQIRTGPEKPETIAMRMKVAATPEFSEKVENQQPSMSLNYSQFSIGMSVNNTVVKNSDQWKIVGQNVLKTVGVVEFEDDGSVADSRSDMKKLTKEQQQMIGEVTEHFLQSLDILYLPLPDGPIQPSEVIRTRRDLSIGIPNMFVPAVAVLKYQYLGTRKYDNEKPTALFEISGTLRGRKGARLNVGGRIRGKIDVSLETGVVVSAVSDVKVDLEITQGPQPIRLSGTLALQIRPTIILGAPVGAEEELEAGSRLFAEREKKWLPAKIIEVKSDGLVRIQYEGHEDEWDDDVPRNRLRFAQK